MTPELDTFYRRIGVLRGEGLTETEAFNRAEQEMEAMLETQSTGEVTKDN